MWSMFRVLGMYNFAGTLPNFWTFRRYYQRMRFLVGPHKIFVQFSQKTKGHLWQNTMEAKVSGQCLEYLGCIILLVPSQIFGPSAILSTDVLLGWPPENFCAIFSEDQGPPLAKHNCVCQSMWSMFKVLGIYNFAGTLPNFWTFPRYYQRMRSLVGPQKIFVQFSQKTTGYLWQNTMEAK